MLKKYTLFFALLISLECFAQAPVLDWAFTFGGSGRDVIRNSQIDPQGNIINVGYYANTVDFDPGSGTTIKVATAGLEEIFIQKLNSNGHLIWVKTLPSYDNAYAHRAAISADGSVYVSGFFSDDSLDLNPDPVATHFVSKGLYTRAMFVMKLTPSGTFLWGHSWSGADLFPTEMEVDTMGNVFTIGSFESAIDQNPDPAIHSTISPWAAGKTDGFLQKLSSNGNQLFFGVFRGPDDISPESIAIDKDQKLLICGHFVNYADFDPTSAITIVQPAQLESKGFVVKLNNDGSYVRAFHTEGNGPTSYSAIQSGNGKSIYVLGSHSGNPDLDPGIGVQLINSHKMHLIKLDSIGNLVWIRLFAASGGTGGMSDRLIVDSYENLIISAQYYGTLYFTSPGSGSGGILQPVSSTLNYMIAKFNSKGKYLWSTGVGMPGNSSVYSLMSGLNDEIIFSGYFSDSVRVDHYNYNWLSGNTLLECVVAKFGNCPPLSDTTLSIEACRYYDLPSAQRIWSDTLVVDTLIASYGCDSVVRYNIDIRDLAKAGYNQGMLSWTGSAQGIPTFNWYDCDSKSIISGVTSNIYFPKQNGSYAIIVTDFNNGCTDTSDCITLTDIDLKELNPMDQLRIYPNPAKEILYLDYPSQYSFDLTLKDLSGREILNMVNARSINLHSLPKGVYILCIEEKGYTTVRKIIKE